MYSLRSLFGLFLMAVSFSIGSARAELLNFDSLPGNATNLPSEYGGLSWNNFSDLESQYFDGNPSGYHNGTVSNPNVIYNAYGADASFSALSGTLSLDSFYLTAAWNDGLSVEVTGLLDGNVVDNETFIVSTAGPILETLDWTDIDTVEFSSFGGVNHGYSGVGTQFALDDLSVTPTAMPGSVSSTPEPSSLVLLGTGALSLAGAARRKFRKA